MTDGTPSIETLTALHRTAQNLPSQGNSLRVLSSVDPFMASDGAYGIQLTDILIVIFHPIFIRLYWRVPPVLL